MDFDYGEIEGYRSVYAQALIQLRKDLASPVQQFFFSIRRGEGAVPLDWHSVVSSHLAALERDRDGYGEALLVPSLSFAVRLWMVGRLDGFGLASKEPRDSLQRHINGNISLRLDAVYGQGDPLLAAVCACEFPDTVHALTRNVGLGAGKADEVADMILAEARPLARAAWNLFDLEHPPAKRSMFRPLPAFLKSFRNNDGETYEKQI